MGKENQELACGGVILAIRLSGYRLIFGCPRIEMGTIDLRRYIGRDDRSLAVSSLYQDASKDEAEGVGWTCLDFLSR